MTQMISRTTPFRSLRPWGDFEQFTLNEQTTIKVITVEPGARLSKQRHDDRGEFWKVLDGPMQVEVDGEAWMAQSGDDIWVPQGATHRMSNPTRQPARILEIAYGHFDELDIERLEDDYAR